MTDLERLYKAEQGANDHLYGLPAFGTEGSASIEAEARMLQNIALTRYDVTVRVRLLALGVLEGNVPELHEVERSSMRDAAGEEKDRDQEWGHAQSKEKGPLRPKGIQE